GQLRVEPHRLAAERALEENAPGGLGRTPVRDEVDRLMEIDVAPGRELRGKRARGAGGLQLLGTPALDALVLRLGDGYLGRRHSVVLLLAFCSVKRATRF